VRDVRIRIRKRRVLQAHPRGFGDAAPCLGARCEFPHSAFGCRMGKTASKRNALRKPFLLFSLTFGRVVPKTIARSLPRHPTDSDGFRVSQQERQEPGVRCIVCGIPTGPTLAIVFYRVCIGLVTRE
jgi:hypothetical protein